MGCAMKFKVKPFIGALALVLITLGLLEFLVSRVDPWGLYYLDDLKTLYQGYIADDLRGYRLADGSHTFQHWTATVEGATRLNPAANADTSCTVAMLGDSVTFGQGVSDDMAWVNLVASNLPNIRLLNTGIPGYSSTNILGTYKAFPDADAYIYLIAGNDSDPAFNLADLKAEAVQFERQTWLSRYVAYMINLSRQNNASVASPSSAAAEKPEHSRFFSELDELVQDEKMTLVGLRNDPNPLAEEVLARGYELTTINYWTHFNSRVDGHANAEGNREIAAQMMPIVQSVVDTWCIEPA
jgi:hypothetical protein